MPPEPRRMTSGGFGPALSRDGKLLAYVSYVSDNVPHIWLKQTAGRQATPVTRGSDGDFEPDFSPDGTRIVFISARAGGGIYVAPTFPGEPKLVVSDAWNHFPHFSPGGDKILFWNGRDEQAYTAAVDGGSSVPLSLNQDFLVHGPALWAPSGNEIIFYGTSKREPEKPNGWWIAPLDGGQPEPARLPGTGQRNEEVFVRAWTRTKDGREWIVYSTSTGDIWKLWRILAPAPGETNGRPELLASGAGLLGAGGSLSEDGKLAYTELTTSESIYEIPTNDKGQKLGPTFQLPFPEEARNTAPSISRDGRWMEYATLSAGKPKTVLLRDLWTGTDHALDVKGTPPSYGAATSISPDGSKAIFDRGCGRGTRMDQMDLCGFMVSAAGGEPEKICESCTARGFSSNGSIVLIQKYTPFNERDSIVAVDLATKAEKDFLSPPDKGYSLYHPFFSWDDRWVVFKKLEWNLNKQQILIAPVRSGVAGKEAEWIAVTDGRHSDDKPQFSPDGNTVYFTSTRDGYLCIWAQKLDPATKHPVGVPVAFEHFHNSAGRDAAYAAVSRQRLWEVTVAKDKILINLPQMSADIWMVQVD